MDLPKIIKIKKSGNTWEVFFDDNTTDSLDANFYGVVSKYSNHIVTYSTENNHGARFYIDHSTYWEYNGTTFAQSGSEISDSDLAAFEQECLNQESKTDSFAGENSPASESNDRSVFFQLFDKYSFSFKNTVFIFLTLAGFLSINYYETHTLDAIKANINGGLLAFVFFASGLFAIRLPIRFSLLGTPVKLYSPWSCYAFLIYSFKGGADSVLCGLIVVYVASFISPEAFSFLLKKAASFGAFFYLIYLSKELYALPQNSWIVVGFILFALALIAQLAVKKRIPYFMSALFLCELVSATAFYGTSYIKDYFFHKVYVTADAPQVYKILTGTEKAQAISKKKCVKAISNMDWKFCVVKTQYLLKKGDYLKCNISTRGNDLCAFEKDKLIANKVVVQKGITKIIESAFSPNHTTVAYKTYQETPSFKRIWNGRNCLKDNPIKGLAFCISEAEKLAAGEKLHCEEDELHKLKLCRQGDLYVRLSDLEKKDPEKSDKAEQIQEKPDKVEQKNTSVKKNEKKTNAIKEKKNFPKKTGKKSQKKL